MRTSQGHDATLASGHELSSSSHELFFKEPIKDHGGFRTDAQCGGLRLGVGDVIKTASAKHRQEKRQGQPQLQPQQLFVAEPPEALSESPGESEREISQLYGSMLKRRSGGEEVGGRSGGDEVREESMGFRVQGSVLEETPNLYSSARPRLQALTKYSTSNTSNTNNLNY